MNELTQVFNYEGANVRTVVKDGNVWFVAKDVCGILEIGNPSQALNRLDNDEKNTIILNEGIGNPNKTVVNEPGLYALILGSRKSEAKAFKRWVTHEVLPSIRKHGAYMTPETIEKTLSNPDFIIQLATKLKEEQQARAELEEKVIEMEPKVFGFEEMEEEVNLNQLMFCQKMRFF